MPSSSLTTLKFTLFTCISNELTPPGLWAPRADRQMATPSIALLFSGMNKLKSKEPRMSRKYIGACQWKAPNKVPGYSSGDGRHLTYPVRPGTHPRIWWTAGLTYAFFRAIQGVLHRASKPQQLLHWEVMRTKINNDIICTKTRHWEDENQDGPVRDTGCLSSRWGRDARATRFPLEFLSVNCTWLYRQRVSRYREMSLSQRVSEHLVNSESCQWPHLAGFQKQSIWEHNLATWSLQIVNWGQLADHNWKVLLDAPFQVWDLPTTSLLLLSIPTQAPAPFKVLLNVDAFSDFCWNNAFKIVRVFSLPS